MDNDKKIAKIILGAKNKDIKSIEKITRVYCDAGVDMIDACADKEVIRRILQVFENSANPPKLCVSITLKNDTHLKKVQIDKKLCTVCRECEKICPQKAIDNCEIKKEACVGCLKCLTVCPVNALKVEFQNHSFEEQFNEIQGLKVDCIEIHTNGNDENLLDVFEFLKANFDGEIGICIAQNENTQYKKGIIEKIKNIISPKVLIVQADGSSISGFDNEIETTRKAVEECRKFADVEDIILIASGGTNSQTASLMNERGVAYDGIAWGSYARKLIYDYVYNDEDFELALTNAKKLVCLNKN